MTKELTGIECRFAIHVPSKHPEMPDTHLIKEQRSFNDGSTESALKFIRNFKRPLYITKPSKRNHKEKKEYEHIDNLNMKEVTQSKLRDEIAKALDKQWSRDHIRKLAESPYLYGTDISSTALIKRKYQEKYPELFTPYSVATLDIETDVIYGTDDPILVSSVFKNEVCIVVIKSFVRGYANLEEQFNVACRKYLSDVTDPSKYNIKLHVADNTVEAIRICMSQVHKWQPDWLAIWNMDFDIPRMLDTLKKYGVEPEDIFCDPSVPKDLRICRYKQGTKKKVTASGQVKPVNPAMQWHTLFLTASFYVIDAMCAYRHIRITKQEEPSYSLDAILTKEIKKKKLKFEVADQYTGLKWHQFMQTNHPIEYMVYNIWDCLSMLELEDKTKDLSFTLPSASACSDFSDFKSQPKKIADALYFYCLEKGYVLGTVPPSTRASEEESEDTEVDNDSDEDDELGEYDPSKLSVMDLRGWVVTLPAHLSVLGMNCIEGVPNLQTNVRAYVFDSDATAAYPTCTSVANVSKSTTRKEIMAVEGIDEEIFRKQNLNFILGGVNSLEYCTAMFNMPPVHKLLDIV